MVKTTCNPDLTPTTVPPGGATIDEHVPLVIRKVLLVRTPVMLAFDYFTRDVGQWWPASAHSAGCGLECQLDGRIYEIGADDHMHVWGHITEWLPPLHLRLAWTRDDADDIGTDVQIDFSPNGRDRTRVEFSHRGWKPHQMKHYIDYRKYWDAVMVNGYQDYVRYRRP